LPAARTITRSLPNDLKTDSSPVRKTRRRPVAHVDDRGSLLHGVEQAIARGVVGHPALVVEHRDVEDLGPGCHAHHADAVGGGGDDAGDMGAVIGVLRVGAAVVADGLDPAGQLGVRTVDQAVEDRDGHAAAVRDALVDRRRQLDLAEVGLVLLRRRGQRQAREGRQPGRDSTDPHPRIPRSRHARGNSGTAQEDDDMQVLPV
jgi:hypothetical protein